MTTSIGRRLASERERLGLTQVQLAELLGKTPQNISNWECGRYQPRAAEIERMAELGFNVYFMLTGDRLDMELQNTL